MPKPTPADRLAESKGENDKPNAEQVASWNLQRMRGLAPATADRFVAECSRDQVQALALCDDGKEMQQLLEAIERERLAEQKTGQAADDAAGGDAADDDQATTAADQADDQATTADDVAARRAAVFKRDQ